VKHVDPKQWEAKLRAIGVRGKLPGALTQTVIDLARAHPTGADYTLPDRKIGGMVAEVGRTGVVTFWLRYRTAEGARRGLNLGRADVVSLDGARELAMQALIEAKRGGDPTAARNAARAAGLTLRGYIETSTPPASTLIAA